MTHLPRTIGRAAGSAAVAVLLGLLPAARAEAQGSAAQHDQQPPPDQPQYPSLAIRGFADIDFSSTHLPEGAHGFSEGQFVLHFTSALSPRVTFFSELSVTPRKDAGTGSPSAAGFNAEVERMILRFDQSDQFKVSLGRYHTPINYWNTAFHHGQWLQTTITRPEMVRFGGDFLPVHFVGVLVEGTAVADGWNVTYQGGLGNGRASVISRAGDAGDNNGFRAWLLNAFSKPDRLYGLQFGGSIYEDRVTLPSTREFAERIVAGHVVWLKENPELIAEVAGVRHRDLVTSAVTWNHAYYVQAAYRLPWLHQLWKPYVRFEHIGINPQDTVFHSVPDLDGTTIGIRYDFTQYACVKGEYRTWTRGPGSARNYGGFMQVAFTF